MPFWKWKSSVSAAQGNAEMLLVASRKRERIYRDFSDGLLTHLRDFAIKVAELETEQFYGSIDRLKVDLPE